MASVFYLQPLQQLWFKWIFSVLCLLLFGQEISVNVFYLLLPAPTPPHPHPHLQGWYSPSSRLL